MFMGLSMGVNRPNRAPNNNFSSIWTGSYSYITPATSATPNPGEIVHGNNLTSQMLFSKTDLDGDTYGGFPLTTGDWIVIGGSQYQLVAPPVDQGAYYSIYIEPQTQKAPAVYVITVYSNGETP